MPKICVLKIMSSKNITQNKIGIYVDKFWVLDFHWVGFELGKLLFLSCLNFMQIIKNQMYLCLYIYIYIYLAKKN